MVSARVQKIKLMDLAFNPVQLSVEVLDRRCVTLLELVGQESAVKVTLLYTGSYVQLSTNYNIVLPLINQSEILLFRV